LRPGPLGPGTVTATAFVQRFLGVLFVRKRFWTTWLQRFGRIAMEVGEVASYVALKQYFVIDCSTPTRPVKNDGYLTRTNVARKTRRYFFGGERGVRGPRCCNYDAAIVRSVSQKGHQGHGSNHGWMMRGRY
jgi:hypothetical protein